LREDTRSTSFKQPSEKLRKTEIKPPDKNKNKTRLSSLALCNAILPSSADRKTKTHEQLALYKTATIAVFFSFFLVFFFFLSHFFLIFFPVFYTYLVTLYLITYYLPYFTFVFFFSHVQPNQSNFIFFGNYSARLVYFYSE